MTTRVMDLLTPLGKGQRALIVAPPRTGKTIMLQHISHGISTNYPDVKLIVLLIDERPEEVTDMRRAVKGEVLASSLDRDIESHVRLSQLAVERCRRLAEMGKDVVLLLDSITRLARAFNKWVGNTGRTMSGGVDIKAMDIPKKLFATARLFEEGGSLTVIGTCLVDTGSRMDELIFQEFKGTGNLELVLDRKLADRRVWPAIDISQSGTRREEKLLPPDILHAVTMLRRTLATMHPVEAMEQLTSRLAKFKSNRQFIELIAGTRIMESAPPSASTTFSAISPIELLVEGSLTQRRADPGRHDVQAMHLAVAEVGANADHGLAFRPRVGHFNARARVGIGTVENGHNGVAAVEGFHQTVEDPLGKIGQALELLVAGLGKENLQRGTKPLQFRGKLFVEPPFRQA